MKTIAQIFIIFSIILLVVWGFAKYRNVSMMNSKPSNFVKLITFLWPPKDLYDPIVSMPVNCSYNKSITFNHKYSGQYSVGISGDGIEKQYGSDSLPHFSIKFTVKNKNDEIVLQKMLKNIEFPVYGQKAGLVYYVYDVPKDLNLGEALELNLDFTATEEDACNRLKDKIFFIRRLSDE
jgi:hypothetical protein